MAGLKHIEENGCFQVAKALLAFPFEVAADRAADAPLDRGIGVDEGCVETTVDLPPPGMPTSAIASDRIKLETGRDYVPEAPVVSSRTVNP